MKKKSKSKKKKISTKSTKPLIAIVGVVTTLFVLRFLYLKIVDMRNRAWQKDYGISNEVNPEGLTYEEFNKSLLPEHRQEPGMREYMLDCPYSAARSRDHDSWSLFDNVETKIHKGKACDREKHVETTSIMVGSHDFEQGVQEFKAWLKQNKLKLGKDVIVEDFYPWDYKEVCIHDEVNAKSIKKDYSCLDDLEIKCIVTDDHKVYEEYIFTVKKNNSLEECKKIIENKIPEISETEKYTFLQEE